MQPIENPFTDADACSTSRRSRCRPSASSTSTASSRPRRTRWASTSTGGSARSSGTHTHVVTGDERILPGGHRLPDRPRDDRAGRGASSVSTRRPSCRASSTRCRRGSRSATGRSCSTRPRSTSIRRPGGRWRSSGSSGSWRSEPRCRRLPIEARSRTTAASERRRPAGSVDRRPAHPHASARTASSSPGELVAAAAAAGVRILAITDHDTLAGVRELVRGRASRPGIELIPGVEINALVARDLRLEEGELHILGFGMDPDDEAFEAALGAQRDGAARPVRAEVARLREIGMPIDAQVEAPRAGRRRRPRPADDRPGADRRRVRDERRGRVQAADRQGRARLRAARGARPARGDRARSAPPAGCRCWPTSARRRAVPDCSASWSGSGWAASRSTTGRSSRRPSSDGRRRRPSARARRDGRHRLPWRPRAVRRGARAAVGAARDRRGPAQRRSANP